eukprot:TRINITY_DN12956_c0_g1_i2.p1 TRINITY_DN12956_c0_g1~~TRINITY_DN12956_c0_g1_i2.p1  ORF type:complete len:122 (+),score=24.65 TRINITY_DN12956_c0_g1_i2:47-367(+)
MSLDLTGGHVASYIQEFEASSAEQRRYRSHFSLADRYAQEFKAEEDRLREIEQQKEDSRRTESAALTKTRNRLCCGSTQEGVVQWLLGRRLSDRLFGSGAFSRDSR